MHETIPFFPPAQSTYGDASRAMWVYYPQGLLRRPAGESGLCPDRLLEKPRFLAHRCMEGKSDLEENKEKEGVISNCGHALSQESFFLCAIKNFGDVPGTDCIYVETVVDRDSGIAFAKVYSARNAMNAVNILATRVAPYFEHQEIPIKEIHTRKTSEYCGLLPIHPFETFLAASQIRHLPMDQPGQPHNYLCEEFYRFLLKDFFPRALRRTFHLSLDELQNDLDAFVGAYNTLQMNHENQMKSAPPPSTNFPVDL